MKKLIIPAAVAALAAGCQMMTTAEKRPTVFHPIQRVQVVPDGSKAIVYNVGYERDTGGYFMRARSPLWATEAMKGLSLDIGQGENHVAFGFDAYGRDLSTNAVAMVDIMSRAAVDLAEKVGAAIATSGGSIAGDAAKGAINKAINSYISKGGSVEKATVTCSDGNCTITDGTVIEECANCFDTAR